jgi:hypothetical protein
VHLAQSSSNFAVFHHVSSGSNREVLREQLQLSQNAAGYIGQKIPVFYSVVGDTSDQNAITEREIESLCQDGNHTMVECRALPSFQQPYEGETLRQLHHYCQQQPQSRVAYLQSDLPLSLKGQVSDPTEQTNLLFHLSRAALSPACIQSVSQQSANVSGSTCNTCGLVFYKLWTLFYPGNMFVSSCEYINQLLPPNTFEHRMQEHMKETLIQRLYGKLQSNLFQGPARVHRDVQRLKKSNDVDRMEVLGIDRFSVDFWLGSHPNLLPCDVSGGAEQSLNYWRSLPGAAETTRGVENLTNVQMNSKYGPVVPALQHDFGSPFFLEQKRYQRVVAYEKTRLLEITFLAGHVWRWSQLYGKMPDPSSPIWSWFPDSEVWKPAAAKYGNETLEKVASQIVPKVE